MARALPTEVRVLGLPGSNNGNVVSGPELKVDTCLPVASNLVTQHCALSGSWVVKRNADLDSFLRAARGQFLFVVNIKVRRRGQSRAGPLQDRAWSQGLVNGSMA